MKLLALYGNPDEIENVSGAGSVGGGGGATGGGGAGAVGAKGGGGAVGGAAGGPGRFGGGAGGGAGAGAGGAVGPVKGGFNTRDWSFQDDTLFRLQGPNGGAGGGGADNGGGGQTGESADQNAGVPPYFIRWVYKRPDSQYSFIIDKNNRVVQIEVVGMNDPRVRTAHGATYGDTFKDLMRKYGVPDGYDISGDTLVLRYLDKYKVAFRLNRLITDHPHQVTAIVVAAGKV